MLLPGIFLGLLPLAPAKIGAVIFAAAFHTSRHYILFTAMACLCVLLGGPSYAAGAESLIISQCGLEVWGNLTLRGTGPLTATGSQCGIHAFKALVVDGCTVNTQADGIGLEDEVVAGLVAGRLAVRGSGRVVAAGGAPEQACALAARTC